VLRVRVFVVGGMALVGAFEAVWALVAEVLAAREAGTPEVGRVLLVEHGPVITVGRREAGFANLLASREALAARGVDLVHTDRGGDITYHGPGQLVAYPILDLNVLNLGLHDYMRLLENAVITTLARFGVAGTRDPAAPGVWVDGSKVCAMGVRVRKWVSMHGLALNVTTDLSHFDLIVPCGLAGRGVTSLRRLLGEACPPMEEVKRALVEELARAAAVRTDRASALMP
jgi:lipoyl(octanoyl) transferase